MTMAPAPLLMLLLSTASAALAHTLWGRRWLQLPIFWLAALAGCLIAYALNLRLPIELIRLAGVPVLESLLLAWGLIFIAARLRI
jgi:hypothetical protein